MVAAGETRHSNPLVACSPALDLRVAPPLTCWCAQVATHKPASSPSSEESNASSGAMFGILCLGAALLLKAIGGAVQEKALKSYGCAPEVVNEMIFWQSLLVARTLLCM